MQKTRLKKLFVYIGIPSLIVYLVFQFVISIYRMPDQTMEETIKKGEWVFVNKLAFGSIFLGMKVPGVSTIKNGDIVYMLDPSDEDSPIYARNRLIARVIASPKDIFTLQSRTAFVNGEKVEDVPTIKHGYRLVAKEGVKLDSTFFNKYELTEYIREGIKTELHNKYKHIYQMNEEEPLEIWEAPMTNQKAMEISEDTLLSYVRMIRSRNPGRVVKIWPYCPYWFWNRWNTQPSFEVPGKGTQVPVNYRTIRGYEEIIAKYERNKIDATRDFDIYINGQMVNSYTVKGNYYIVYSDNRDRFYDTRTWGLVPENYILGRVMGKE
jgi:signal peptidase I